MRGAGRFAFLVLRERGQITRVDVAPANPRWAGGNGKDFSLLREAAQALPQVSEDPGGDRPEDLRLDAGLGASNVRASNRRLGGHDLWWGETSVV